MNFKFQRNCAKTCKISSPGVFHQHFPVFHMNLKKMFSTFGVVGIFLLEKIVKTVDRRSQYSANNLGTKVLSYGLLLKCKLP